MIGAVVSELSDIHFEYQEACSGKRYSEGILATDNE